MFFFVLKRKHIIALVMLCLAAILCSVFFRVAEIETVSRVDNGVRVPVLMYHSILKDPAAAGAYVISPQTLEADLRYLKEHGYTTILSKDLVAYTQEGKPLPEKPVMITFDDGHANNLLYVLPIFEKLDMCGVVCVVGKYSETYSASDDHNPSYAYLSWDEMNNLLKSGRFEIANHSYNLHERGVRMGAAKKYGEDADAYRLVLETDLMKTQKLIEQNCNYKPIAFSYPFGTVCNESKQIIKDLGFLVTFGCSEEVNYITGPESLFCMGRFNRPSGVSTEMFMKQLEE